MLRDGFGYLSHLGLSLPLSLLSLTLLYTLLLHSPSVLSVCLPHGVLEDLKNLGKPRVGRRQGKLGAIEAAARPLPSLETRPDPIELIDPTEGRFPRQLEEDTHVALFEVQGSSIGWSDDADFAFHVLPPATTFLRKLCSFDARDPRADPTGVV